ncbi:MAG: acyltransferase [Alphaproteobacteria bacterium]|nr:acyltransferase [Alphaproteobacteria bacterium]
MARRPGPAILRPFGALRLILALLVVVYHFGIDLAPSWMASRIVPLGPGNAAVMIFFMLSGFIILEAVTHFYAGRPMPFLVNRLLRLVPGFLAALALSILVHAALWAAGTLRAIDGRALPAAIFSPTSLFENVLSIVPGLDRLGLEAAYEFLFLVWSLRAEFLFYLAVFAAVALATARFHGLGYERMLRWNWGGLAGVAAVVGTLSLLGRAPNLFQFGPYFLFGAAVFLATRGSRAALAAALASIPLMALQFWDYNPAVYAAYGRDRLGQYLLMAALAGLFAWLGCRSSWRPGRWDRMLGDLAYPLYLNHLTVGVLARSIAPDRSVTAALLAFAASIALAALMQAIVEPPVRAWRNRWRGVAI